MTDKQIAKTSLRTKRSALKPRVTPELDSELKGKAGSNNPEFNYSLIRSVVNTQWTPRDTASKDRSDRASATLSAMGAFKPTDEIEGMLAAQAIAMHLASMECFRRAMHPEQPFEIASKLRKDGANLSRAMTDMLDALDRKRGKGPQVVRVERVVVQEGGQAVVGNVTAGGGG